MKVTLHDAISGRATGIAEVPDDVVQAAMKVRRWMEQQKAAHPRNWKAVLEAPEVVKIIGLQLAD